MGQGALSKPVVQWWLSLTLASRRTPRARSLLISTAMRSRKTKTRPLFGLFSDTVETPSVANSDGHFSVPRDQRVRAAATTCIAPTLPRRVSSCVDLPALVLPFRFHFAASLRQAHGASPPRRKRSRRPSCLRSQPRGYHHRHRINYQQRRWGGSARVIWPCCSVCVSHRRDVPTGTVMLRGVRDESYIDVTANSRSSSIK